MSTTMALDRVKYMAGVLLEKYNKIFYHTHSKTTPRQRGRLLEALWIYWSQPLPYFLGLPSNELLLGRDPQTY